MGDNIEEIQNYLENHRLPVLEGDPQAGQWYSLPVPGAVSAEGLPYRGLLRKGTDPNLIVCFAGGGVSLNAYTASQPNAPRETFYLDGKVLPYIDLMVSKGIFAESPDNPFRNWSCIFVSYATGDFHVGNGDYHYTAPDGSPAVLHHHGYRNYRGLMDQAIKHLAAPEKLLITGYSAGGFGASALASDLMSYFPECRDVTCCPDSSMLLYEQWQSTARDVWQAEERIWGPLESSNICLDWLRSLYAEKGTDVRYLYLCSIRDAALAIYQHYIDQGTLELTLEQTLQFERDLKTMVHAMKAEIPGIGIYLLDIPEADTDPALRATQHTFILTPKFSQPDKNDVSLRDWLWSAVNGNVFDAGMELLNC